MLPRLRYAARVPADPPRPRQQGLFGPIDDPPPRRTGRASGEAATAVRPAVVPPEIGELAAALSPLLHLGTSSWAFAGWSGIVYAEGTQQRSLPRHGLQAYAQHPLLRAVGVDRSFYAPVDRSEFAAMAAAVPDGFRFLVKATADFTTPFRRGGDGKPDGDNPRYLDAAAATALAIEPAALGLGDKLAAIVFQFPPQGREVVREPRRFADALHAFGRALPRAVPWAVELRDPELLTVDYAAALHAAGGHHCLALHARMPGLSHQLAIAPPRDRVIARWMLQPGLHYEQAKARYEPFARLVDPDPRSRAELAQLCSDALLRNLPITVVINNKAEGSAPLSVLELARAIRALRA